MTNPQNNELVVNNSQENLAEIVKLCQARAHPGCNPDTHELASKILKLLGVRGEAK